MCGAKDMCTCDPNWQGSDCSLRTCPFGVSHVDIPKGDLDSSTALESHSTPVLVGSTVFPYGTTESYPYMVNTAGNVITNTAHNYAECSNKGLCDRSVGQCECLPGYDGHACQRASCPSKSIVRKEDNKKTSLEGRFINQRTSNSASSTSVFTGTFATTLKVDQCSGHGTCETIKDLARNDHNNIYELWDKDTSMGCDCDAGYGGADCSERQCVYGIDPLWTDDTTARVTQTVVRFETADTLSGEYAIKFFDVFGEDYITKPISITTSGTNHCADVKSALKDLPDSAVPNLECSQASITPSIGFEYTLTFTKNPGILRELEIIDHLDGPRPTVLGTSYIADVYTKVNGEFVDNFAEKCEGVTVKVVVDSNDSDNLFTGSDVRPGSIGYLEVPTEAEEKLLKACLGHSDYDPDNNVDVANWDKGAVEEKDDSTADAFNMIGAFPHAIKVVPKETTSSYTMFTPGEYHLVWYDSNAVNKFRVANVNNNANTSVEATESYVYTTKGTVQQLGWGTGTELSDNSSGANSTPRIVGYFDKFTNKVFTNYDTSCENQPDSALGLDRNHVCVEKGDKLFIIDSCWGLGNSGAVSQTTNPIFGGKELSCSDSTDINHHTGNIYTVTKVYKKPISSAVSVTDPTDTWNTNSAESATIVDTFVIEVDANLGWTGQMGDPENSDTILDGSTDSTNTGIVTLFHFSPSNEGTYEYVSQCGNRGSCNHESGICACFSGYTGNDCATQNALR